MTEAHMTEAHMTEAHMTEAHMTEAHMTEAHMTEAHMTEAHMTEAHMTEAHITDSTFFVISTMAAIFLSESSSHLSHRYDSSNQDSNVVPTLLSRVFSLEVFPFFTQSIH